MSTILAKMKKLQRAAPDFPEVRIRLTEAGNVCADVMNTYDQASVTVVDRLRAEGRTDISLNEFVALVAAEKATPGMSFCGKTIDDALDGLLTRFPTPAKKG